jgi:5-methylthioadenosine/S-adenosylhomocysteine deaminase
MDIKRSVIKDGGLRIQDGKIVFVGDKSGLRNWGAADQQIDGTGKFIFPGFINAHAHMFQVLFRNVGVDLDLLDWLRQVVWPLTTRLTKQDVYAAARLGIVENIKSGVTCVVDNQYPQYYEEPLRAMDTIGFRGVLACGYYESGVPDDVRVEPTTALKRCESLIKKYDNAGSGRLRVCPAPMHPCFTSEEIMVKSKELAAKYDTYLHVHTAESERDVRILVNKTGKRDIEFLHDLGVLDNRFLAIHSVNVTQREVNLLARAGAHVVHNPVSNMYLGSGVAPIPEFMRKKVNVALGTDGPASNCNQDIIETMKFAACLQKVHLTDPSVISAQEVLQMATINGAKALGIEDMLGSIEVGKKGDVVIMDLFKPNTVHVHDPVGSLVYSATSENVDTVVVDGKVLMQNRRIAFADEGAILVEADKAALRLLQRAGVRD